MEPSDTNASVPDVASAPDNGEAQRQRRVDALRQLAADGAPALASVLRAAQQPIPFATSDGRIVHFWDTASVSWSPDGRTLATILPGNQFADGLHIGSTFITLVSTTTGQAIKQFRYKCPTTTSLSNFAGCKGNTPLWSPTGQQIAFLDSGAVQLTLWKV